MQSIVEFMCRLQSKQERTILIQEKAIMHTQRLEGYSPSCLCMIAFSLA